MESNYFGLPPWNPERQGGGMRRESGENMAHVRSSERGRRLLNDSRGLVDTRPMNIQYRVASEEGSKVGMQRALRNGSQGFEKDSRRGRCRAKADPSKQA